MLKGAYMINRVGFLKGEIIAYLHCSIALEFDFQITYIAANSVSQRRSLLNGQ